MGLENTGLPNGGITTYYKFLYDSALAAPAGPEPARTQQAMQSCDADFQLMQSWFTGVTFPFSTPMEADVLTGSGTASWGPPVDLNSTSNDAGYLRMLLIAEVTEMFMKSQAIKLNTSGWFPGYQGNGNEGSIGEGLSRFLAEQFLIESGLGLGEFPSWGWTANSWLTSPNQPDWVNHVDPSGDETDIEIGCSILFIYYLYTQLAFSINQIIAAAASNLAGVYTNLTQDTGNPFPFFQRLLQAYPGAGGITTGANLDNPFPVGLVSIWEEKSDFGYYEVQDLISGSGGVYSGAFWVVVEGFSKNSFNSLGITVELDGSLTTTSGIHVSPSAKYSVDYEDEAKPNAPQRIRVPYDITFSAAVDSAFPPMDSTTENELDLHAELQIAGQKVAASDAYGAFFLVGGADPYFNNVDPAQNNVWYLSQDLRVFTATPAVDSTPVPGAPGFGPDSTSGAYEYIQNLLGYLNSNAAFTSGASDPFAAFPDQTGAYTGDSSVTPFTTTSPRHANYNFAVARVRLRGTAGQTDEAQNVKVFFRLFVSQSPDTDYQPATTYESTPDAAGLPGSPLVGSGTTTIPFFATGNLSANTDYGPNGINNQTIEINTGDTAWQYFGCFLDVYDSNYLVNGKQVQKWLAGTHHCVVAQIAYDKAPIATSAQVTASPANSDKLAQRNLQITLSDNPGGPETHRIPQAFDVRPSPPAQGGGSGSAPLPDELMIDWGEVPVGSVAQVYWPQVNASDVLALANAYYAFHALSAADMHTLECVVTDGVTYIPIPPGTGENYAGLLTIDLPQGIVAGQEFDVVIRRVVNTQVAETLPPPGPQVAQAAAGTRAVFGPEPTSPRQETQPAAAVVHAFRYVAGAFQVTIPVSTPGVMLPAEEDTLAILKWRLQAMDPASRWIPVLERYVSYISGRVQGLGGDPGQIPPSVTGAPVKALPPEHRTVDFIGQVGRIAFDCHGDFTGFTLDECGAEHTFETRDRGLGELVMHAFRERFRLLVVVRLPEHRILRIDIVE